MMMAMRIYHIILKRLKKYSFAHFLLSGHSIKENNLEMLKEINQNVTEGLGILFYKLCKQK